MKIIFEKILVRKVDERGDFLALEEKFPISSLEDVTCSYIMKITWKPVWYRDGTFKIWSVQLANLMYTTFIIPLRSIGVICRKFLSSAVAQGDCVYVHAKRDTIMIMHG